MSYFGRKPSRCLFIQRPNRPAASARHHDFGFVCRASACLAVWAGHSPVDGPLRRTSRRSSMKSHRGDAKILLSLSFKLSNWSCCLFGSEWMPEDPKRLYAPHRKYCAFFRVPRWTCEESDALISTVARPPLDGGFVCVWVRSAWRKERRMRPRTSCSGAGSRHSAGCQWSVPPSGRPFRRSQDSSAYLWV